MDDYLHQFLSSSDANKNNNDTSFWGLYEADPQLSTINIYDTSSSIVLQRDSSSGPSNVSSYMDLPLNAPKSSLNLGSPNELSVVANMPIPPLLNNTITCDANETSEYQRNFQPFPSIPEFWTPEGAASLPSIIGKDNMQSFGLNGAYEENDIYGYVGDVKTVQLDNLSVALPLPLPLKGKEEWQNHHLSSFLPQPQRTMTTARLQSLPQSAQAPLSGDCDGTGKPRVRARRGQATDPHSIAERLRREKIAERMKNLQELVPNSNKADKASMLDEIIDYVKFLQLQVKVLSMSRLGATEAVVPLITDSQAEGSHNGLILSPSVDQGLEIPQSPEQSTFEQEVVKLMESNVTRAMQYLQRKGLCLMPIALAAAISNGKSSSSSSSGLASEEMKKFGLSDSPLSNNSSCSNLSSVGSHQMCSDGYNVIVERNGKLNGCNRAVLKLEEMNNSSHIE